MALPVLDGNQSATTLSSVVTGGEHIVAHSVVCLGSTAIANITNAVSGSVVSISNFPSTQTVAGTVTANLSSSNLNSVTIGVRGSVTANSNLTATALVDLVEPVRAGVFQWADGELQGIISNSTPVISGTVTANVAYSTSITGYAGGAGSVTALPVVISDKGVYGGNSLGYNGTNTYLNVGLEAVGGNTLRSGGTLPISGTVTANASLQNSNSVAQAFIDESNSYGSLSVVLSGSAGNIGVVGTVTAAAPNGSLTTRFGTPTTANVSFATAAVTKSDRKYLLIQNVTTGSNVITVGIGFTPTTTQGIQLTAGAGITFESSYIPTGAVYVLSSVTASNFTILEA